MKRRSDLPFTAADLFWLSLTAVVGATFFFWLFD